MSVELRGDYRWPDDAIAIARELEVELDLIAMRIGDLATLARAHFSSAGGVALDRAGHDLKHATEHIAESRRTLERVFEGRQAIE